MKVLSHILISTAVALTGLGTVQAEISQIDPGSFDVPAAAPKASETGIFIVMMEGDPVIAYDGDVDGFQATRPGKGKKLNPKSAHVKKYAAYLAAQQQAAVDSVGAENVYSYRFAFNGFAARMTEAEANALRKRGDVVKVWKDEIMYPQTDGSPNYIGITQEGQAWSKGNVGEDVVIGIIDTGVWPEHPSFADVATPKKGNKGPLIPYEELDDFSSSGCDFGNTAYNPADAPFECNNKLLTARCYNKGQSAVIDDDLYVCGGDGVAQAGAGFQSARDDNSHGSHVGGTAGGNYGVPAFRNGEYVGDVSGIAPRARIAAYKVCWLGGGCASSDSAAAIDQAVFDGVDVINFSIGGPSNFFGGADDIAFLFAADAGVWVATSNGNAGPGAGTVGTPAGVPWITAVGATQDDGVFYNQVRVNSPGSIAGDYVAVEGAGDVRLADTGAITANVTHTSDPVACSPIDPMPGDIALASRGGCTFKTKYDNAAAAGAVAIIVYNNAGDPIVMGGLGGTTIPGVMVSTDDGLLMAGETGVNATLDPANEVSAANRIAGFSSRGPNNGAPDIIKPDVSAPGVAILAAASPAATGGEMFISINGTSMASPHVAGAFALLKQAHPDWSAAMARSALMTTARNGLLKTFGTDPADPFDVGAGEILPSDAFDPGWAYDAGFFDYLAVLCTTTPSVFSNPEATCGFLESIGFSLDPSQLNLPSIGIADLVGTETITRTVTAVYNNAGNKTLHVAVDAPPGIDVTVSPPTIKLRKGDSASYDVTFTTTPGATLDEWAFGSLTWADDDGNYAVRSPIAVKPTAFSAPDEVDGVADGAGDGSVEFDVQFGYDGDYSAVVSGLEAGSSFGPQNLTGPQGNLHFWCFDIPANTHVRIATFDEDTSDPGFDDIDLRAWIGDADCATSVVLEASIGTSGGATSEEVIDYSNGPARAYFVAVDFYAASNGTDTDYVLWVMPVFGDNGNTSVTAPASAVSGTSGTVTVDYSGLAPTRNLGVVHHVDGGGEIDRTILDIDAR